MGKLKIKLKLMLDDLKQTTHRFTRYYLHVEQRDVISGRLYDVDGKPHCAYCHEGIFLRKAGVTRDDIGFTRHIKELTGLIEAKHKLIKRYGASFDEVKYGTNSIPCPLVRVQGECGIVLHTLEEVI